MTKTAVSVDELTIKTAATKADISSSILSHHSKTTAITVRPPFPGEAASHNASSRYSGSLHALATTMAEDNGNPTVSSAHNTIVLAPQSTKTARTSQVQIPFSNPKRVRVSARGTPPFCFCLKRARLRVNMRGAGDQ